VQDEGEPLCGGQRVEHDDERGPHRVGQQRLLLGPGGLPGPGGIVRDHKVNVFPHSDFTGRNLMPILDGVLVLLEETAADGLGIHEVLGDDIDGFCSALTGGEGARSYRDRWREQLNRNVAKKLGKLGG
jgi:DNA-binding ferritin-like protein (Dps family)